MGGVGFGPFWVFSVFGCFLGIFGCFLPIFGVFWLFFGVFWSFLPILSVLDGFSLFLAILGVFWVFLVSEGGGIENEPYHYLRQWPQP